MRALLGTVVRLVVVALMASGLASAPAAAAPMSPGEASAAPTVLSREDVRLASPRPTQVEPLPEGGVPSADRPERVAEVVEWRTESASTFVLEDGSFETAISSVPVRRLSESGWVDLVDGFAAEGGRLSGSTVAGPVSVNGAGVTTVELVGGSFSFALRPDAEDLAPPVPEVGLVEGVASVRPGMAGVSARVSVSASGVKEDVFLDGPRPELVWDVSTSGGVAAELWSYVHPADGQRHLGNAVVLSAGGETVGVVDSPFVEDAAGVRFEGDLEVRLEPAGESAWTYRLVLPTEWLEDPGRVWPVRVDPSVSTAPSADCELNSFDPYQTGSLRCGWDTMRVGGTSGTGAFNSIIDFDVVDAMELPSRDGPVTVRVAEVGLAEHTVHTDGPQNIFPLDEDWDGLEANWFYRDLSNTWTDAGGTADFNDPPLAAQFGLSGSDSWSNEAGRRYWYPTEVVQDWLDGDRAEHGFVLTKGSTSDITYWSSDAADPDDRPELKIRWWAAEGIREHFQYQEFPLSDSRTARVNVGNGNLVLSDTDLVIGGVAGHDVVLSRTFNGLNDDDEDYGAGWTGTGQRMTLETYAKGQQVVVTEPDGYPVTFLSNSPWDLDQGFTAQGRTDLTLTFDNTTSRYIVRENKSGTEWRYTAATGLLDEIVDRSGNVIDYRYDTNGLLEEIADTRNRSILFTYTGTAPTANVATITDPANRTVEFTYTGTELETVTDLAGEDVEFTYDGNGRLTRIDEPENHRTDITYVTSGLFTDRVASITRVTSGGTGPTTSFAYAQDCSTIDVAYDAERCTEVTDPNSNVTVFYIDDRGRNTRVVDAKGHEQEIGYDASSNVVAYTPETAGTPITSTYSTDGLNNLLSVTAPTGATTTYGYTDADNPYAPSEVTTPQGDSTLFDYDNNGRLTTATAPTTDTSSIAYNPDGTVDTVTDPNNGVTSYGYNGLGELTSIDSPGPLGDVTYTYDGLSRIATTTDGNLVTTTIGYDDRDRTASIAVSGGPSVSYTYDGLGNRLQRVDAAGTYTTTYDKLNRITTESLPGSRSLSYSYDPAGNLTSLTDPAGTTTYSYDVVNLVEDITVGTDVVSFTYDARNRPDTISFPNGVTIDSNYDDSNRIVARTATGPGSTVIEDWAWTYTSGVNDTALVQTQTIGGVTTTYGYDTLDRLVAANSTSDSRSWTWDANSNRLTSTHNSVTDTFTYNAANQITNTGYSYDSAGNRTADPARALGYDDWNRTTNLDGTAATYLGAGQNELDTLGATTLTRALPGLATNGGHRYIRTPSGQPIGIDDGTDTYWLLADRLGSITGITDPNGAEVIDYAYTPFGEVTTIGTDPIGDQPLGYASGYTDRASGLINYGQRWYDPTTATWTQPDPAGTPDGPNRYAYVHGNPVNATDPSGLITLSFGVSACLVVCVEASLGVTSDGVYLSSRLAFGPEAGLAYSGSTSSGGLRQGASADVSCSAGFSTVTASYGTGGFGGSAGFQSPTQYGCSAGLGGTARLYAF